MSNISNIDKNFKVETTIEQDDIVFYNADDERFEKVKRFVDKHNISNDTFGRLLISYIKGYILKFNDEYGDFNRSENVLRNLDNACNHIPDWRVANWRILFDVNRNRSNSCCNIELSPI